MASSISQGGGGGGGGGETMAVVETQEHTREKWSL